ncbi:MAG: tetratricopeptide repeat protein [Clostridia bacterium]|nr:tetratricopeptide repeat protein [Clostridia bacterium]
MGKMILCRGRQTDRPLIIEGTGIRLYTAEELCYYIYNNIYLIGQEFVNGRLVEFLAQTGENELSERVRNLIDRKAGLAEILVTILKTVDYYSVTEIEQIREILNTLGKQNVCERLKARGDGYLHNDCYFSALKCYEKVINDYKGNGLSGSDYAKVYHNLGVSYARMFLYGKAAEYFDEAYRIGQHEYSLKCAVAARIMEKKDRAPVNVDATEEEYVVGRELETLMDNARYSDEYRELENMDRMKSEGRLNEYNAAVNEKLTEWKKEYMKYCKTF